MNFNPSAAVRVPHEMPTPSDSKKETGGSPEHNRRSQEKRRPGFFFKSKLRNVSFIGNNNLRTLRGGRHRSVISDVILPTFSGAEERTQGRDKRDKLPPPLPLLLLLLLLSDCMVR